LERKGRNQDILTQISFKGTATILRKLTIAGTSVEDLVEDQILRLQTAASSFLDTANRFLR
jgi:hypothetical protein